MDTTDPLAPTWTVVLPLKGGPAAKSRLAAAGRTGRPDTAAADTAAALAVALARDCLAAVLACPRAGRVLVVTADPVTASWAAQAGATAVPEAVPGSGLDAAARDGLAAAQGRTAILLGDLPALRPDDLDAALDAVSAVLTGPAAPAQAVVPDADGTGTVLLAALLPGRLTPSFGAGSAARHQRAGALRLDLDLPRLRRDVDTGDDLAEALALGCGPATRTVVATAADRVTDRVTG